MTDLVPPPYWVGGEPEEPEEPETPVTDWINKHGPIIFTVTLFATVSLVMVTCAFLFVATAIKSVFP